MERPLTIAFHQSEPQSAQKDQIIARLQADSVVVRANDEAHPVGKYRSHVQMYIQKGQPKYQSR
jgi:hypothetical protein